VAATVGEILISKSIVDIDLGLTDEHITTLERGAQWSVDRGFAKVRANMRAAVNTAMIQEAAAKCRAARFNPNKAEVSK
jgi:hypothetical protein